MRVVIVGGTGNLASGALRAFASDPSVEITAAARRTPAPEFQATHPSVDYVATDVRTSDLTALFRGADVVVHLAWLLASRSRDETWSTNVLGTKRVLDAVAAAGVPSVVYSSSIGAYSRSASNVPVDESHPTNGIPTSRYSVEKAYIERMLDRFELDQPSVRVVRLRPAIVLTARAGVEYQRLFLGPLLSPLFKVAVPRLPALPLPAGLQLQVVHSDDVGTAIARFAAGDQRGGVNIATAPVLDARQLSAVIADGNPTVKVPERIVRAVTALAYVTRSIPAEPGWVDLASQAPIMDTARASDWGWAPSWDAADALRDALRGILADCNELGVTSLPVPASHPRRGTPRVVPV